MLVTLETKGLTVNPASKEEYRLLLAYIAH